MVFVLRMDVHFALFLFLIPIFLWKVLDRHDLIGFINQIELFPRLTVVIETPPKPLFGEHSLVPLTINLDTIALAIRDFTRLAGAADLDLLELNLSVLPHLSPP